LKALWRKFRALTTRAQVACWVLAAAVAIVGIAAASRGALTPQSSSKPATPTTMPQSPPTSRAARAATSGTSSAQSTHGLQGYIDGLNQKLMYCEVAVATMQVALSNALETSPSSSGYARLYATASQAAPACSYPATSVATYDPPSGYPSLAGEAYGALDHRSRTGPSTTARARYWPSEP